MTPHRTCEPKHRCHCGEIAKKACIDCKADCCETHERCEVCFKRYLVLPPRPVFENKKELRNKLEFLSVGGLASVFAGALGGAPVLLFVGAALVAWTQKKRGNGF